MKSDKLNKIYIAENLIHTGEFGLNLIAPNGEMPSGHNGPYNDRELPTRNTAHWSIIFAFNFRYTQDKKWEVASKKCFDFLLSENCNPYKKSYFCRTKKGKDKCNGLVGQAWVIEALVYGFETFNEKYYIQEALRLYRLHPFNKKLGIWNRVEIDGMILTPDYTFNHQLWFASTASLLIKYDANISSDVKLFINNILNKVQTYNDGIIYHASNFGSLKNYISIDFISFYKELKLRLRRIIQKKSLYEKSVGYFGFNLHAISVLEKNIPDVINKSLFKRFKFGLNSEKYKEILPVNIYGYYYNVSGFENSFYCKLIGEDKSAAFWYREQLNYTWKDKYQILFLNTPDKNTAIARVYQLVRLYEVL